MSTSGEQANAPTFRGPISRNGRFVAFSSFATNLVPDDYNHAEDVFLRDRRLGTTTRVSVTSTGGEANGGSYLPLLSADGRLVFFRSVATNLVAGDRNGVDDLFVHDMATGRTERIPLGLTGRKPNGDGDGWRPQGGCQSWCANALSADGSVLEITSSAPHLIHNARKGHRAVFVRARGRTTRESVGWRGKANRPSEGSSISANGRVVAFRSFASNLVRGDTNRHPDVFVRDLATGATERVNTSTSGEQANGETFRGQLSANGRFVAFRSRASNLVSHDTNGAVDAFVHDRLTGRTVRVSVATGGAQATGPRRDTRRNSFTSRPYPSPHGRYVAFTSRATNLVPGDTNRLADVFVHDLDTGRTVRASVPDRGGQANGVSRIAAIGFGGRVVGFISRASNLVPGDTNGRQDYFVRVRGPSASCRAR